ncbi:copper transporter 6-like [Argentina anserina]|uniref:copper transporter 6-like n=1 Tax=Argentina anserina TaxID=57926 RepID=UPI0021764400|nr:copper transporter 6-like [Potentilla anserina]
MSHEVHDEGGMPMPPMAMTPPSTKPMGDLSNTSDSSMIMNKSLYWGNDVIILFSGWPGHDHPGMYVLSLAFLFLLAIAVEILSVGPTLKPTATPLVSGVTQTGIYALRTVLAYLVMLSVMSFNVGVLIAVVAGHALGFFVVKVRALNHLASQADPTDSLKV